ncbi:hypothetical protein HDF14_001273 [Edaphobacter lichenicola]|jgi:hypothetical protein|uniref:Uncharacterized protein n=1 Tax=Tunturiibacter gelidiferens TaxID=3069689 RepID=A0A9X0U2V5_9BACT|nr:hypothetical protein [Edaphobacter lichenicola]
MDPPRLFILRAIDGESKCKGYCAFGYARDQDDDIFVKGT